MQLETIRISLRPFAPAELLALIEGAPQFERQTGLRLAEGLRDFYVSGDVSPQWLRQLQAGGGADPWLHGFALIHRDDGLVVGCAGFKGPPDEAGIVEMAYGIVPDYQGRGLATEAAAELVRFAIASGQVRLIRAHTLPTANASTRVLTKCGFTCIGEVVDPDDGPVWRWERC